VRLKSFTAEPSAIAGYGPLVDGRGRRVALTSVRPAGGASPDMLIARVEGVATRDAAEALNRTRLHVDRGRLPPPEDADEFLVADLVGLNLGGETVDVVFSTATFHWIADHDALFASLRGVLRSGGRLVAQCGGAGNIASVHAAARQAADDPEFRSYFEGWRGPWNFATPEDTERRLRDAGFAEARCWLADRPVQPDDAREYLRTINLGAHLDRLPDDLRYPFVDAVLARLGERPVLDYVRLNIDAVAA
jgi:SAM-dependent methyltransferase